MSLKQSGAASGVASAISFMCVCVCGVCVDISLCIWVSVVVCSKLSRGLRLHLFQGPTQRAYNEAMTRVIASL